MLVTFDYYQNTYKGTAVIEGDFPRYEMRASQHLTYITMNKVSWLDPIEDEAIILKVQHVMCEVIDLLKEYDDNLALLKATQSRALQSGIKSESIKSHSVTFTEVKGNEQEQLLKGTEGLIYSLIRKWLLPTGLLYRGL